MRCLHPTLLLFLLTLGMPTTVVRAQMRALQSVKWAVEEGSGEPILHINLSDAMSDKQKALVHSGFTAYSLLSLQRVRISRSDSTSVSADALEQTRLACTAKFDMWSEVYDITTLQKTARQLRAKNYSEYGRECLNLIVANREVNTKLAKRGGEITVLLQVTQLSPEKSAEIKDWLIRQQTGVMQGIYAHMLGDLKISEKVDFKITIPPAGSNP